MKTGERFNLRTFACSVGWRIRENVFCIGMFTFIVNDKGLVKEFVRLPLKILPINWGEAIKLRESYSNLGAIFWAFFTKFTIETSSSKLCKSISKASNFN